MLVCEDLLNVLIRAFEVREEQNVDFLGVARDLDQVDDIVNLMEVPIEDLSGHLNAIFAVANIHRWRSLFGDDVDLVRPLAHSVIYSSAPS